MSLVNKSEKMLQILGSIEGLNFYHLFKPATVKAPYAVWQEDSEGQSFHANDRKLEQVLSVSVDYFTSIEFDPMIDNIQDAFNDARIAWNLNSLQYETETNLMHYEWLCEVI
jgi:hypothetical protein